MAYEGSCSLNDDIHVYLLCEFIELIWLFIAVENIIPVFIYYFELK